MTRERDSLGRPLPPGIVGEPGIPDRPRTEDTVVWIEAIDYLDRGLPFHAHEVFEERWRSCPARERDVWRALAQWGAAETHVARGNPRGAAALAARAMEGLDAAADAVPDAVDFARVRRRCAEIVATASEDGRNHS